MSNNSRADANTTTGDLFNTTDLDAGSPVISTAGKVSGAILITAATSSTGFAGVTDARPLSVQLRDSSGNAITPATSTLQTSGNASLTSIDGKLPSLSGGAVPVTLGGTQPVSLASGAVVDLGAQADAAAASDSGTASLISLFKRLLGRITTLIGQLPTALSVGGNLKVSLQETNATQAVSGTVSVSSLPNTTVAGQTAVTSDYDTGGGTVTTLMVGVALPASGGPVAGGTATNPFRVDVTGSTTQPVSGTVSISGTVTVDTEMPAAASLADATANPSTPLLGAANLVYNGTTWDRLRGTTTNGAYTDLRALAGTTVDTNSGNKSAGTQRVVLATDQPALTTPMPATLQAATSGGATPYQLVAAAGTNATSVKASAGTVYGVQVSNVNAAVRYLKLYDKSSAPTVGTDTPVKTIVIPGNTAGAGNTIAFPYGIAFANGIALALTVEPTVAGSTGVTASEHVVNLDYK